MDTVAIWRMQDPERAKAWHEEWRWNHQAAPRDERGPNLKRARTDGYADMNAWQEWVWDDECESGRGGFRQPSRKEYRQAGNARKGNRPRGGGAKAEWFSEYQRLQRQDPSRTRNDIIAEIGPVPASQTVLKMGK